ncbi:MAG: T9SS type A sorting domain-containing protein [Paludibacter sp.]
MKKITITLLFCSAVFYVSSQSLVKLRLPDNCNSTNTTTAIQNLSVDKVSELELFPNPNPGIFTLRITFTKKIDKATITVYNTNGKVVYSEIVFSDSNNLIKKIKINGLHTGTYLFEVKNVQQLSTTKLVIK